MANEFDNPAYTCPVTPESAYIHVPAGSEQRHNPAPRPALRSISLEARGGDLIVTPGKPLEDAGPRRPHRRQIVGVGARNIYQAGWC